MHFTVTCWFQLRPSSFLVIPLQWTEATSRSTPWGAYRSPISCGVVSLSICLQSCIYSFHTLISGRWKYGGWAFSDSTHILFNVQQSHRHDGTHPSLFNGFGSTLVRLPSHMCQYCPWGDLNSQHSGELLGEAWLVKCTYPPSYTTPVPQKNGSNIIAKYVPTTGMLLKCYIFPLVQVKRSHNCISTYTSYQLTSFKYVIINAVIHTFHIIGICPSRNMPFISCKYAPLP